MRRVVRFAPLALIYRLCPRFARMTRFCGASADLRAALQLQPRAARLTLDASISKLSVLRALRRKSRGFPAVRAGVVKAFRLFLFLFTENIFAA